MGVKLTTPSVVRSMDVKQRGSCHVGQDLTSQGAVCLTAGEGQGECDGDGEGHSGAQLFLQYKKLYLNLISKNSVFSHS